MYDPKPEQMTRKIITAVLIILMALSITGTAIYWLYDGFVMSGSPIAYTQEWQNIFHGSLITDRVCYIYGDLIPSLAGVLISLANLCLAVYYFKSKKAVGAAVWAVLSLAALVINHITLEFVLSGLLAG